MYELLLEVGCEELPARHVEPMLEAFKTGLLGVLSGISYDSIHTYATPRRLAIAIQGLATHRLSVERVITGPAAEKAFQNGVPTQDGFAHVYGHALVMGIAILEGDVTISSNRIIDVHWWREIP